MICRYPVSVKGQCKQLRLASMHNCIIFAVNARVKAMVLIKVSVDIDWNGSEFG